MVQGGDGHRCPPREQLLVAQQPSPAHKPQPNGNALNHPERRSPDRCPPRGIQLGARPAGTQALGGGHLPAAPSPGRLTQRTAPHSGRFTRGPVRGGAISQIREADGSIGESLERAHARFPEACHASGYGPDIATVLGPSGPRRRYATWRQPMRWTWSKSTHPGSGRHYRDRHHDPGPARRCRVAIRNLEDLDSAVTLDVVREQPRRPPPGPLTALCDGFGFGFGFGGHNVALVRRVPSPDG